MKIYTEIAITVMVIFSIFFVYMENMEMAIYNLVVATFLKAGSQ